MRLGKSFVQAHLACAPLGGAPTTHFVSPDVAGYLEEPYSKIFPSPEGRHSLEYPDESLLSEVVALFVRKTTIPEEPPEPPVVELEELAKALLDVNARLYVRDERLWAFFGYTHSQSWNSESRSFGSILRLSPAPLPRHPRSHHRRPAGA